MAASVAEFKLLFEEFATTDPEKIAKVLEQVEGRTSSTFGEQRDEAIYLQVADTLSAGTGGRNARTAKDGSPIQSTYAVKLAELQNTHALFRRMKTR